MSGRVTDIIAFVGIRGSGKTVLMKRMLPVNRRNLIIPSDRADAAKAYAGIRELKGKWIQVIDPRTKRPVPRYVFPELHTFTGNRVAFIEGSHSDEMFDAIARSDGFRSGGLFLDDFKNYIPAQGNLSGNVLQLFRRSRFSMIDIYLAAHSFQDINAQIISFGIQWFIFNVERGPSDSVREKLGDRYADLMRVHRDVQRMVPSNPHAFLPYPPIAQ